MRIRTISSLIAIVAVLCLISACASTDAGITTKVKSQFVADDIVKSAQIDVDTQDGVVTLTGNADSTEAKNRALELARNTDGVVDVVDMISARRASGDGQAPRPDRTVGDTLDDAGITLSVKNRLLGDPLVKGLQIDVDTRDGIVFLTGSVRSNEERQKAIDLSRETEGVRDVQANLTLG